MDASIEEATMFRDNEAFSSYSVDDLDRARGFYGETLGLEVGEDPMGFLELRLAGGGRVMIYPKPDHQPATFTVLNFVVPNIEEAVDALAAAGVEMQQYDMADIKTDERGIARGELGPPIAWFADPAGNVIAVIQQP